MCVCVLCVLCVCAWQSLHSTALIGLPRGTVRQTCRGPRQGHGSGLSVASDASAAWQLAQNAFHIAAQPLLRLGAEGASHSQKQPEQSSFY